MNKEMNKYLELDDKKIEKITNILINYLKGDIKHDEAKQKINSSFEKITAQEFALCEQHLEDYKIDDNDLTRRIEEVISLVEDVLITNKLNLPEGHPIDTYLKEVKAIRDVLDEIRNMLNREFIKNQWLEIYDKLLEIKVHFARKQNQLFPALEKKGFNKPSKIMWTLDDNVEDVIKQALEYLKNDEEESFLSMQKEVIDIVEDMMQKEEDILYPTAMEMISDEEFVEMRKGDDEIGYSLIEVPPLYGNIDTKSEDMPNGELLKDLKNILVKHGVLEDLDKDRELDVSQGKLTLEQINLIFKHLQVDLSYVDENEISKFYSDTKHRVFPRSPGVIGRKVQNCHPKESVDKVEEIIRAFRSGEHDEAEFWIDMGDEFIYIIYNAVRDENGKFRGVLEMMQDVTRIRKLEGSQRLISWKDNKEKREKQVLNKYDINSPTLIGDLVKEYPYIKDFLIDLSPKFKKLKNPAIFKTMSKVATLDMISKRGNIQIDKLISKIVERIDKEKEIE
ncbi:PAS domain-containing protein [Anaeromonas gelatinilytica]|uniref:PAS domain-containing protein n=1 Tax=Anaeromonas gelatinilytica TaxID=2683194 RepID=UPI002078A70D|nr:PAS domain-containing protein [Anaeromonas gelatinilytica]